MENPIADGFPPNKGVARMRWLPALISLVLPGVGQLLKGHVGKALLIWGLLIGNFILTVMASAGVEPALNHIGTLFLVSLLTYPIIYLWNIYDAYRSH